MANSKSPFSNHSDDFLKALRQINTQVDSSHMEALNHTKSLCHQIETLYLTKKSDIIENSGVEFECDKELTLEIISEKLLEAKNEAVQINAIIEQKKKQRDENNAHFKTLLKEIDALRLEKKRCTEELASMKKKSAVSFLVKSHKNNILASKLLQHLLLSESI